MDIENHEEKAIRPALPSIAVVSPLRETPEPALVW
jgi:hypothetical protein